MSEISITDLEALCLRALENAGLNHKHAKIVTDHYLENELSGKASHGIVRVNNAVRDIVKKDATDQPITTLTDKGNVLVLDANFNLAPVACMEAVESAAARAQEHGIALIGVRNYLSSSGSMSYYLRRLADKGITAIMGCNSVALVAPPGGRERMLGTNPVGITIPGEDGQAMIADFSTSAIAYGKIMVMEDKGDAVPEGVLIDKDGQPSTNPKDAYDGAILPLADYRGFALGLMIEILAGPLLGGKAIKKDLHDQDGLFIIAIDGNACGGDGYAAKVSETFRQIYGCPTAPGTQEITLPGDRSAQILMKNRSKGVIDVVDKTLDKLKALAQ